MREWLKQELCIWFDLVPARRYVEAKAWAEQGWAAWELRLKRCRILEERLAEAKDRIAELERAEADRVLTRKLFGDDLDNRAAVLRRFAAARDRRIAILEGQHALGTANTHSSR